MPAKARGKHYFPARGPRIAALRVRSRGERRASHPHDLTEVEHDHDFMELVLVLRGRARQRLEGEEYPVQAGDVYILHSRSRHYFHQIEDLELINVLFDPRQVPIPQGELRRLPGYCALFLLEPQYRRRHRFSSRLHLGPEALVQVRRIGEEMVGETARAEAGSAVMLLAGLLELITFLSRQYGRATSVQGRELLRVARVIQSLEQEYQRNWRVAELARLAGMSRSTFIRTFEGAVGHPPIDYLIRRRVAAAMELLRGTDRPVTDIALEAGFSDSNYFARQFRRVTGMTPSRYRGR